MDKNNDAFPVQSEYDEYWKKRSRRSNKRQVIMIVTGIIIATIFSSLLSIILFLKI